MIDHLPGLRRDSKTNLEATRLIRFIIVGSSGVVVNSAVLWMLTRWLGIDVGIASALSYESAVFTNFTLHYRWTFASLRVGAPIWQSFLRFNLLYLGGLIITPILMLWITKTFQVEVLVANVIAIVCATGWNYVINRYWVWSATKPGISHQSTVRISPQPTGEDAEATSVLPVVR